MKVAATPGRARNTLRTAYQVCFVTAEQDVQFGLKSAAFDAILKAVRCLRGGRRCRERKSREDVSGRQLD